MARRWHLDKQLLGYDVAVAPAAATYLLRFGALRLLDITVAPATATYLLGFAALRLLDIAVAPATATYLGVCGLSSKVEKVEKGDGKKLKHGEGELLG